MAKTLYIMRGLPGTGKSTRASLMNAVVCSADDYFMENGKYIFDPAKIAAAHQACQQKARYAMETGCRRVVVDNTNTQRWEFAIYKEMAKEHGYQVVEVVFRHDIWTDDELAARNRHGVPGETIARMRARWED